jgi:hypothetical protein
VPQEEWSPEKPLLRVLALFVRSVTGLPQVCRGPREVSALADRKGEFYLEVCATQA